MLEDIRMGATTSSFYNRLVGKKEVTVLMGGLWGGGKTTIIYLLKTGEFILVHPTKGILVETITHNNIRFTLCEFGGDGKTRPLYYYRHNRQQFQAVIFVIDSTDRMSMEEAEWELKCLFSRDELKDYVLLVLANKQDLPNAMTVTEVTDKLRLNELSNHKWHVQPTSAVRREGLQEGFNWLANEVAG